VQTAITYVYITDTAGYRNYLKPDSSIYKKYPEQKEKIAAYYEKKMKRKVSLKKEETTGATQKFGFFYMHPPRANQFSILFNAPHPMVYFSALNDSVNVFKRDLELPFVGDFNQTYTVVPIDDVEIAGQKIRAWRVTAESIGDDRIYAKGEEEFNSTLEAIFTYEYGFIKMHYAFANGIRIQMDFEKLVVL
jgi:hypothetical protein